MSWRSFWSNVLPQLKRYIDLGHEQGLKVLLHGDGSLYDLIPSFVEIGLDGLWSVQPSSREMEPARLNRAYGDRMVFMRGIDTRFVLLSGTPESVRRQVRDVVTVMKPVGGVVASPNQDYLLEGTPVENVIAMLDAIKKHGNYQD